jgi:hypothetical protein
MAGFMPAIHVLLRCAAKDVDARMRGHDESEAVISGRARKRANPKSTILIR